MALKEKEKSSTNSRKRLVKTDCIQEAMISHNMLVCQVASFSSLCITMSLKECLGIDKHLLKA
jgi:hypothetical protein